MTKGLQRSISRAPKARAAIIRQTIGFSSAAVVVDGATGVGFGSFVIGDFPEGNIHLLSAQAYAQFTGPGSASVSDTWEGDYGIGTTPASDGTITAADVDIIASTALAAATSEVSPRTRGTGTGGIFDNTDGSLEINLNLLVDDAHIGADDLTFLATGELYISYMVLGDD